MNRLMGWLWNFSTLGGCAYVVFWKGRSPLWFILAVLLLVYEEKSVKIQKNEDPLEPQLIRDIRRGKE